MKMEFVPLIGHLVLLSLAYKVLSTIYRWLRCYVFASFGFTKDLKKYGKWVIVTGATDGIGKEYALQFAKKGFSIVLISRNQMKLDSVAQEIERQFQVETKTICFDFSETSGYEKIEREVRDLDVGILVNNVGMGIAKVKKYHERAPKEMFDIVHVNDLSFMRMSHIVLKGMLERKRGAIVYVSSGVVYFDYFPAPVYKATKVFMNTLVKSLQLEYYGVIDQQILMPFGVATNIAGGKLREFQKDDRTIASASEYVESAIKTIGIADMTHGYFIHELVGIFLQLIPNCIINYLVRRHKEKHEIKEKET